MVPLDYSYLLYFVDVITFLLWGTVFGGIFSGKAENPRVLDSQFHANRHCYESLWVTGCQRERQKSQTGDGRG